LPIAAYAFRDADGLHLRGIVASLDGTRLLRAAATGPLDNPTRLGAEVADSLVKQGAHDILKSV
jgi:hydroxymethylbilane synthase